MKPILALSKFSLALSFIFILSGRIHAQPGRWDQISDAKKGSSICLSVKQIRSTPGQWVSGVWKTKEQTLSPPDISWTKSYYGDLKDECYNAIQTSDGGYIMTGRSNSYGAGDFDAWVIKTDASGAVSWSKTYGDYYIDESYMIKELAEGGYIIAGMSTQFGWAGEGWLIKTDANGNVIWNKGYHPETGSTQSSWDYFNDVIELSDHSFVVVGYAADNDNSLQAWILKIDTDGNRVWEHEYGDEFWERLYSVQPTTDGGFVAVGDKHVTYNDTIYKHDGWLLKFDNMGDTLWTKHFGSIEHDIFRSVKQTSDGGYIISGERQITEQTGFQGWLVRTDANGNEIWNKTLDNGGLYAVQQTSDGNFLAAGMIITQSSAYDGWLLKADTDGNVIWQNVVTGSELDDMFLSLNKTSDGGYILGGKFDSDPTGGDYWLVKMEAEGLSPLTYFYENFDTVQPPALPGNWSGLVHVLLTNTIAEVKTLMQGSATSAPNAAFIMNGLNGSNGQPDTTAFVALVTPYVRVGSNGATLTFWGNGGNSVQVGKLTDPSDPSTFSLIEEVPLTYDFTKHTVTFTDPCTTYIALKNSNNSPVTPIFLDDIEFKQINAAGVGENRIAAIKLYPNPVSDYMTLESPERISEISVINNTGAVVYSASLPQVSRFTLNTSGFATGMYIVKAITVNGNVLSRTFLIVR